jgi:hypothetical protein
MKSFGKHPLRRKNRRWKDDNRTDLSGKVIRVGGGKVDGTNSESCIVLFVLFNDAFSITKVLKCQTGR